MDLERNLSWAEAAMESHADGILVVDENNTIVGINSEMQRIWGFPTAALDSKCSVTLAESVQDKLVNPQAFMAKVGQLGSLSEPDLEDLHFCDGRIIERVARLVTGPQGKLGRVLVFRDVTAKRQAEDNRRRMESRLRVTQKLESLGVLAGGIAHEFNNMLMVILGNAGLLEDGLTAESEKEDSIKEIQLAGRRAADLCTQMLAYSGKGRFVVEPVALHSVVEEMKGILDISIGKSVSLHCSFEDNLPAIDADLTQIRQVIMNLVTNASEACDSSGGNILLDVKNRSLTEDWLAGCIGSDSLYPGSYVVLEVADNGKGMDPDVMNRIFEPFFSTNFTGRGLGLSAVLGILRGHHGGVHVDSIPGSGSMVTVFFPVSESQTKKQPFRRLSVGNNNKNRGNILLVDDEKTVLRVASLVLQRAGFSVVTAAHGQEAIAILEENRSQISCVILDLTMPVMDGLECSKIIKKQWADLPVILSSGYTESEATNSFDGELAGFLQKPYVAGKLIETVRQCLFSKPDLTE